MTRFVILAVPRTGSNLLCTLLNSHPEILCHHEVFNPQGIFTALTHRHQEDMLRFPGRAGPGSTAVSATRLAERRGLFMRWIQVDVGTGRDRAGEHGTRRRRQEALVAATKSDQDLRFRDDCAAVATVGGLFARRPDDATSSLDRAAGDALGTRQPQRAVLSRCRFIAATGTPTVY